MATNTVDALEKLAQNVYDQGSDIKNSNRQRNAEVVDLNGLQITRSVGSVTTTYYGTGSLTGNAKTIAEYLSKKGLNHIQISAIMGSMEYASGYDYTYEKDSKYGLLAWSGSRATQLYKWGVAMSVGWKDLATQLDFFWMEFSPYISTGYATNQWGTNFTYDDFVSASDVSTAVVYFGKGFEKDEESASLNAKRKYAEAVFQALESGTQNVTDDQGGRARFYISIPKDLVYFHRYEFKLVIEGTNGKSFDISIDGHDIKPYLYAQYPKQISGEGFYPSFSVEENYDMLEAAGDLIDEGSQTFANSLLSPGLHEIDIVCSNAFTVTMILYLKYSHTSR